MMYIDDLGEIIAVRKFGFVDDEKAKIEVRVGKPRPFDGSSGWYCPFQIVGIGGEEIKYAAGVDAMQSLQTVMVLIGATLEYFNGQVNDRLRWEGSTEKDLGFPVMKS